MSYPKIFSQFALSTVLGAGGTISVAQAQPTIPIFQALVARAIIAPDHSFRQTSPPMPYANHELSNVMAVAENMPHVRTCFKEHAIDQQPLQDLKESDARAIVNCADQKIVTEFLKNPASSRYAIGERVDVHTSAYLRNNDNFAQRVARQCQKTGRSSLQDFASCAKNMARDDQTREMVIVGTGGMFMLAAATAVFYMSRRRRSADEQIKTGPRMDGT